MIYSNIAWHLYPSGDQTLASHVEGGNDDHSAIATHFWILFWI